MYNTQDDDSNGITKKIDKNDLYNNANKMINFYVDNINNKIDLKEIKHNKNKSEYEKYKNKKENKSADRYGNENKNKIENEDENKDKNRNERENKINNNCLFKNKFPTTCQIFNELKHTAIPHHSFFRSKTYDTIIYLQKNNNNFNNFILNKYITNPEIVNNIETNIKPMVLDSKTIDNNSKKLRNNVEKRQIVTHFKTIYYKKDKNHCDIIK